MPRKLKLGGHLMFVVRLDYEFEISEDALRDRRRLLDHLDRNGSMAEALQQAEKSLREAILHAELGEPNGLVEVDGCPEN